MAMEDNTTLLPAAAGTESMLHPYYPLGAVIPGYVANTMGTPAILGYFALACVSAVGSAFAVIKRTRPGLPTSEVATALWFVLCGCIHFVLEGYFVAHHKTLGADPSLLGEMWKEYALSDSRYLTSDAFVVCMEGVTAWLWGPLSIVCAYFIVADHPARHQLQTVISLGQLYGVVLYYVTCYFEESVREIVYSIPNPLYFWGYYVLLNSFWAVIPTVLIYQSTCASMKAFTPSKARTV